MRLRFDGAGAAEGVTVAFSASVDHPLFSRSSDR